MSNNIQGSLLSEMQKSGKEVKVFLTNGFQLSGEVIGFDNFTIILNDNGQQKLIYKHAVSTIVPEEEVNVG
ncbi:RNA chaperone Hfq [Halarsenatibacter silvermanii]|uniref:RNA-binding protein Hfq n=1 Tax=Halarsenatibacter silvermanii TaxID=321763 RepID=A0A1G9RWA2_9FIRM|nr:RNA chaperone Hfq [Halarsenatibacter silvermanii]SDM27539.1 RNA-binding protein Hfq [Halarsenatibacter silvermanii]